MRPAYGVSDGPLMVAVHASRLSESGKALIPGVDDIINVMSSVCRLRGCQHGLCYSFHLLFIVSRSHMQRVDRLHALPYLGANSYRLVTFVELFEERAGLAAFAISAMSTADVASLIKGSIVASGW